MADIAKIIGKNLKKLRTEMKISLDMVSDLTGISKSMLSGIEKGNKSPTVSLLWKLCEGLNITLEELLHEPARDIAYYPACAMESYSLEKGVDYCVLFHFTPEDHLEFYRQTLAPHTARPVSCHSAASEEYVIVTKGEYTMKISDKIYRMKEGDSIQFAGNYEHSYWNESGSEADAIIIISHNNR